MKAIHTPRKPIYKKQWTSFGRDHHASSITRERNLKQERGEKDKERDRKQKMKFLSQYLSHMQKGN